MWGETVSEACDAIAKCIVGLRSLNVAWQPAAKVGVPASATDLGRRNKDNEHINSSIGINFAFFTVS